MTQAVLVAVAVVLSAGSGAPGRRGVERAQAQPDKAAPERSGGCGGCGSPRSRIAQAPELEPLPPPGTENPWSRGVSPERRRAAEVLFKQGNALLKESIVGSAAAKYRAALDAWDHPSIHFNLALALIVLDQPVETHEQLVLAMKYGPAPLGKERHEHARNYLALLESQLARVKVRCAVEDAKVELDGKPLFTPPGEWEGLVRAGRHTFVASKDGLVTNQSVRILEGGQRTEVSLELMSLADLTTMRRRWPVWRPWAVVGAGAAIAIGAGAFQYAGVQKVDWVNRESRTRCPEGCATEPADLASARSQARTYQGVAVGGYVLGAAVLATGATLVWLNRAEPIVKPYSHDQAPPAAAPAPAPRVEVLPTFGEGLGTGLLATLRF